jgi:non-heme chloroperoxidase
MPFAQTANGLQLSYGVTGSGSLAIIFQHGWASTGHHFDQMLAQLPEEGRRYIALDLAGHGASTDHAQAHGIEPYARQLLAVADHAGAARFVTVGHSMGGKINQYLRLIAPDRLLGQVSIAPSPAGLVLEEASDTTINYLASMSGNPEGMAGVLRGIVTVPLSDEFIASWSTTAARTSSAVLAATLRSIAHTDFESELVAGGVIVPTLAIAGRHDPIYALDKVETRVRREAPHAVVRVLDCGHDVPNERPREAALLLDGFLAALESSR